MSSDPRRLLLTGYEPFGGDPVNPSAQLVESIAALPPDPDSFTIRAVILPVARDAVRGALQDALYAWRPDAVIAVGQATGRDRVELELVARNRLDYKGEADNSGCVAAGEPLVPDGPEELAVSLDLESLCAEMVAQELPVRVSRDAGRHLCNALLYELLHRHASVPAFFVHVPLLPEQAEHRARNEPSLPASSSRACLAAIIRHLPVLLGATPQ